MNQMNQQKSSQIKQTNFVMLENFQDTQNHFEACLLMDASRF